MYASCTAMYMGGDYRYKLGMLRKNHTFAIADIIHALAS